MHTDKNADEASVGQNYTSDAYISDLISAEMMNQLTNIFSYIPEQTVGNKIAYKKLKRKPQKNVG